MGKNEIPIHKLSVFINWLWLPQISVTVVEQSPFQLTDLRLHPGNCMEDWDLTTKGGLSLPSPPCIHRRESQAPEEQVCDSSEPFPGVTEQE